MKPFLSTQALPLLLALLAHAVPAQAQNAAAGRTKAQQCAVCHGPAGISSTPDAPHLAGQPPIYLVAQLKAYRSGERRHEVMAVMARMLKDEDIEDLAAWYASIRIEAKLPQ